jgi:hypothetical protein
VVWIVPQERNATDEKSLLDTNGYLVFCADELLRGRKWQRPQRSSGWHTDSGDQPGRQRRQHRGDEFGMAFSVVRGKTAINGQAVGFPANHLCGQVTAPSWNATMLHNHGLAPLGAPPDDFCK